MFSEDVLRQKFLRVHNGDLNTNTGKYEPVEFKDHVAFCIPNMAGSTDMGLRTCVLIAGFRKQSGMPEIVLESLSAKHTSTSREMVQFFVQCLCEFFDEFVVKRKLSKLTTRIYISIEQEFINYTKEIAIELSKFQSLCESIIFIKGINSSELLENTNWLNLRAGQRRNTQDFIRGAEFVKLALENGKWSIHPNVMSSSGTVKGAIENALNQFSMVQYTANIQGVITDISRKTPDGKWLNVDLWETIVMMVTLVHDLTYEQGNFADIYESDVTLASNLNLYM